MFWSSVAVGCVRSHFVPGVLVGPGVEVSSYLACRWRSDDSWGIKKFAMYEKWWEWSVRRLQAESEVRPACGEVLKKSPHKSKKTLKMEKKRISRTLLVRLAELVRVYNKLIG